MAQFSERMGFRSLKNIIQTDTVDTDLRISLWNAVGGFYFRKYHDRSLIGDDEYARTLLADLWVNFFKRPLDEQSRAWDDVRQDLKDFLFECSWWEVYDYVEFVAQRYPQQTVNASFILECNRILKREVSAYRFVGGEIVRITSDQEIAAIEEALKVADTLQPVHDHLKQALSLLADRKTPDYRNSIKESISAVEALCKLIAGDPQATLGSALAAIQKSGKIELHGSLKDGLAKLYGYTNDAEGIRHALKVTATVDYEDALFMLTICSGFVNYLIAKAQKAGIAL